MKSKFFTIPFLTILSLTYMFNIAIAGNFNQTHEIKNDEGIKKYTPTTKILIKRKAPVTREEIQAEIKKLNKLHGAYITTLAASQSSFAAPELKARAANLKKLIDAQKAKIRALISEFRKAKAATEKK